MKGLLSHHRQMSGHLQLNVKRNGGAPGSDDETFEKIEWIVILSAIFLHLKKTPITDLT
jgi:hypothetical protein